jgi:DnaK suppressor protein
MWYIPASLTTSVKQHPRRGKRSMEVSVARRQLDIARLESARQEIMEDMQHLQADLRSMAERSADEADVDAYEREKTWALVLRLQRKLESVERALRMAENGTYGICETCGNRIDPARLEILPEAALCLKCQREFERQNQRRR